MIERQKIEDLLTKYRQEWDECLGKNVAENRNKDDMKWWAARSQLCCMVVCDLQDILEEEWG